MRHLLILALVAGCGSECEIGESTCRDNRVILCGGSEQDQFATLGPRCGDDSCVDTENDGLRRAVCTSSGSPDPRCAAEAYEALCVDPTTLIACNDGYSYRERTCSGVCVQRADDSDFCATDPAPSAACTTNGPACEAAAAIDCRDGYVVDRIDCGGGTCLVDSEALYLGGHLTFCVSDATCEGNVTRCGDDGHSIEGCAEGRVVAMTCNVGTRCDQYTLNPTDPPEQYRTQAACVPDV